MYRYHKIIAATAVWEESAQQRAKKCKNEKNLRVNSQASIECKVYLSTDLAFLHCGNKAQHYLLSSVREILEIRSGDDVRDSWKK